MNSRGSRSGLQPPCAAARPGRSAQRSLRALPTSSLMKFLGWRLRELRQFFLRERRRRLLAFQTAFEPNRAKPSLGIAPERVANVILIRQIKRHEAEDLSSPTSTHARSPRHRGLREYPASESKRSCENRFHPEGSMPSSLAPPGRRCSMRTHHRPFAAGDARFLSLAGSPGKNARIAAAPPSGPCLNGFADIFILNTEFAIETPYDLNRLPYSHNEP